MASQVADYEITSVVADDGPLPCLRARRPARLGEGPDQVTIWVLGPLARTAWEVARARLALAAVRAPGLPDWLEAGVGEYGQRSVVWTSATTPVVATLAAPPTDLDMPSRLRALASRGPWGTRSTRARPASRGHLPSGHSPDGTRPSRPLHCRLSRGRGYPFPAIPG